MQASADLQKEYVMLTRTLASLRLRGKDGGFTQVELAVVLLVIAVLTGASMVGYQSFQTSGKTAAVRMQIGKLISAANAYAQSIAGNPYGTYYNLAAYAATGYNGGANSLLPSAYTSAGISNAFGGMGTLAAGTTNYTYTVIETALPSDVCTNLYTSFQAHLVSGSCSGGTLTLVFQ